MKSWAVVLCSALVMTVGPSAPARGDDRCGWADVRTNYSVSAMKVVATFDTESCSRPRASRSAKGPSLSLPDYFIGVTVHYSGTVESGTWQMAGGCFWGSKCRTSKSLEHLPVDRGEYSIDAWFVDRRGAGFSGGIMRLSCISAGAVARCNI